MYLLRQTRPCLPQQITVVDFKIQRAKFMWRKSRLPAQSLISNRAHLLSPFRLAEPAPAEPALSNPELPTAILVVLIKASSADQGQHLSNTISYATTITTPDSHGVDLISTCSTARPPPSSPVHRGLSIHLPMCETSPRAPAQAMPIPMTPAREEVSTATLLLQTAVLDPIDGI